MGSSKQNVTNVHELKKPNPHNMKPTMVRSTISNVLKAHESKNLTYVKRNMSWQKE